MAEIDRLDLTRLPAVRRRHVTRRELLRHGLSAAATAALLGAAEAMTAAGRGAVSPGLALAASSAGTGPRTLTLAQAAEPSTLDPQFEQSGIIGTYLNAMMEHLMEFDRGLAIKNVLAQTSAQPADGVTYRFKLRPNMKFWDGEPVDAEAVRFTYERALSKENRAKGLSDPVPILQGVDHVKVVDPLTVDVVTGKPSTLAWPFFCQAFILAPKHYESLSFQDAAIKPMGSGPWKFVRWSKGDRLEMAANAEYWRGRPQIDTLVFRTVALKQQNVQQAIQCFQSAISIQSSDDGVRALAEARALAEKNAQAQTAQEQARRAAEVQKQREAELARSRAQLEQQRRRQQADAQAQRQAQEARDQAAAAKFVEEGKKLLAQGKFDGAVTSFQAAQRLHKSNEVDRLITQTSEKAAAAKQDGKARADQARVLAEQKARRDQAEALAAKNRELYTRAVQEAQKAFAEKRFDQATARYQEADKLFHTDAVLNGLRQIKEAQDKDRAAAEAARQKQLQQQQQAAAIQQLLNTGRTALAAGQVDAAAKAFAQAKELAPDNAEVLKGVLQTEQAQRSVQKKLDEQKRLEAEAKQKAAAGDKKAVELGPDLKKIPALPAKPPAPATAPQPKPQPPPPNVAAEYTKHMQLAAALEKQRKYDDVMNAYKSALKLMPGDGKATVGLHMAAGQKALAARKFPEAAKEFEEVLRISPNHAEAAKALQQARQGRP